MKSPVFFRQALLSITLLLCQAQFAAAACIKAGTVTECDSIYLSNGKVYAVKNLTWTNAELSFSFCDDAQNKILTAPWQQIRRVKKTDGTNMHAPFNFSGDRLLTGEENRIKNEVNGLQVMAVLSIPAVLLFGVGWILAAIVLIRSNKLSRAIVGHPNEQMLRKKIKRARMFAKINLFAWLLLGLIGFGYLIYFFSLFNKM